MNIGDYIAKLRKAKGLSQRALYIESGVSHTEISRIESGERKQPSPNVLKSLSDALDADYREIMKIAGYYEEVKDKDEKFEEIVFTDGNGDIVDVRRAVKEMYYEDTEWANVAFRVSKELNSNNRKILKQMAQSFLDNNDKN